jgi:MoCo/4Fe-4S cofactor protein with predicted Tat translocation signal
MNKDTHSPVEPQKVGSDKYWLSLDQWRKDPEFQKLAEKEFMSNPLADSGEEGWARREFLKLMGASMALTSFGCIRRPAQKIVPYAKRPPEIVPGLANYYASSYVDGTQGIGIVVTTREGRPIKIEGNPLHPSNQGGMSARAHAHILSLYDPERLTEPKENLPNKAKTNGELISADLSKIDEDMTDKLSNGKGALLTSSLLGPATRDIVEKFVKEFGVKHYIYDTEDAGLILEAQKRSYGRAAAVPRLELDKAKYILTVDSDILGTHRASIANQKGFSKGRKPGPDMNKLVSFESLMSLTGTKADERFRIKPSQQAEVVMGLIFEIVVGMGESSFASNSKAKQILHRFQDIPTQVGIDKEAFKRVAGELWEHRGKSIVVAGGLTSQAGRALELQCAVNWLNSLLGNDGVTIDYDRSAYSHHKGSIEDVKSLVKALNNNEIDTLIIHGVNPMYSLPKNAGLREALADPTKEELKDSANKKLVKTVYYTGDRYDETARAANYVVPDDHPLEKWGDLESQDGVYSVQQPTIQKLYDTRSFEQGLMDWFKAFEGVPRRVRESETWHDYVTLYWKEEIYGKNRGRGIAALSFDDFWTRVLQEGVFVPRAAASESASRRFDVDSLKDFKPGSDEEPYGGYEIALYETVGLKDGTLANVSWLQEFPDPVTKICWDNYVCMSPADAERLGAKEGSMINLRSREDVRISAPIHIQPGQADRVLGLAVGYGRLGAGEVADNVGVNGYTIASVGDDPFMVSSGISVKAEVIKGETYPLANVQGHHSMEGRQIVVEQTVAQYMKDPQSNIHKHKIFSLYPGHEYKENKWGMVIDQTACTGCSSCIVACQSENNIPTVGKRYVLQGREMHWIRVDRYYVGDPESPDVVNQPLVCQHCENAPCEAVCPVQATVHSDQEGTNDMIYNRCVGTRYCANNCPYKVRRFNWFNYVKTVKKPQNYAMNPEVTVRARGVMEKCTFCTHKIKTAKLQANVEKRELKDGDVKTACQLSCPTGAIIFGDLNDPNSEVSKHFYAQNSNTYGLLEEWGTYPSVKYKTVVRNKKRIERWLSSRSWRWPWR